MSKSKKKSKKDKTKYCLVYNCENSSNTIAFIGDLCSPCHRTLTNELYWRPKPEHRK